MPSLPFWTFWKCKRGKEHAQNFQILTSTNWSLPLSTSMLTLRPHCSLRQSMGWGDIICKHKNWQVIGSGSHMISSLLFDANVFLIWKWLRNHFDRFKLAGCVCSLILILGNQHTQVIRFPCRLKLSANTWFDRTFVWGQVRLRGFRPPDYTRSVHRRGYWSTPVKREGSPKSSIPNQSPDLPSLPAVHSFGLSLLHPVDRGGGGGVCGGRERSWLEKELFWLSLHWE